MSLVADIKSETSKKKAHGGTTHEEAAGAYNLEYDTTLGCQSLQASYPPFPNQPSAPIEILASDQGPVIRRVLEFAMYLEDKDSRACRHTYTSLQSETPSAPKVLADVNNWRGMYPALATNHDQGPIDCPLFLFDTQLSLTEDDYASNLAIRFSMEFSHGAHFTDWRSYPKFYERNGCPVNLTESLESSDVLESEHLKGTDNCRFTKVPFRSAWWVWVFSNMIHKKKAAQNNGDAASIEEEEERAIQDVQGLSVMQEIWATHRDSNHQPQRMAILLWRFDIARRGERATTSWRQVLPLLSAYNVQSPHPPSEDSPMILDTTLQAAASYATGHNSQPSIFSGYPTEGLLTAPLSEDSSSSTTTPGSRSFPSLASNSTYPLYPSQESSFRSQNPAYPSLGTFDFQDSGYSLSEHHEVIEASHKSYGSQETADGSQESYLSQEVIYHSQDSLYQHSPDRLYEYTCPIVESPDTALASQDFTGGQIQLSYAQTEDSQSSYEAPLITDQAHMVHQPQLIQHLQHLDQHQYLEQNPDDLHGGHDELDEQAHAQPLPQSYELNGLTIDYSTWEETLRLNPDLQRHLSINTMAEVGQVELQYMSPGGQEGVEPTQGKVLGEAPDKEDAHDRQLEC